MRRLAVAAAHGRTLTMRGLPEMLPGYEVRNALVDFSPITNAIDSNQHNALARRKLDIEQERTGLDRRRLDMQSAEHADQRQQREIQRIGREAEAIHGLQGPQRAAIWQQWTQRNPKVAQHMARFGIDPADHVNGPAFLATEAAGYDPLKRKQAQSQIDLNQAHASYYRNRGALDRAEGGQTWKIVGDHMVNARNGEIRPIRTPTPDMLQGVGMDADGNLVPPSGGGQPRAAFPDVSPSDALPYAPQRTLPPPMKLGGPTDDIDASMRIDEGRPRGGPPGVQVAQTTGRGADARNPQYEPHPGERWGGNTPTLMDQAKQRVFGTTGTTTLDVPGIVTTPRGSPSVFATREDAGRRAYDAATPEQQARFAKFRQDQQLWTAAMGKPARAGYYYGPNGQELAMSDRVYKGDREQQGLIKLNLAKIDEAHKSLLDQSFGWAGRSLSGAIGYGENARAFEDLKQAAMNIAYVLSGKSVGKAEFENFMSAYGPKPGDSDATINHKVRRMKEFFTMLGQAQASGMDGQQAWAKASTAALTADEKPPAQGAAPPASSGWSIKRID